MFEGPIQELIDELARLPGIGPKSAQRLAFYLVKAPPDEAKRLAEVIIQAKERISFCRECGNVAEGELCRICRDERRDKTVLCVVDATLPVAKLDDALLKSQLRAADVVALSKVDLVDDVARAKLHDAVRALRPAAVVVDAVNGNVPAELLFPADPDHVPALREPGPRRPAEQRFETLSWTSDRPVSLPKLQQAIARLAPKLARAKGLFETVEQPGRQMVFQLAGRRATLVPGGAPAAGVPRTRIVFIAEVGMLSREEIDEAMKTCVETN